MSHVPTNPGLTVKNTNPFSLNSAAYFALTMFTADLDAEYDAETGKPLLTMKSTSPTKLEIVTTFFVGPFSRRGRKAFTTRAAPMTFVLNYKQVSFVEVPRKAKKEGLTNSLNSSIRTSSLPMLKK